MIFLYRRISLLLLLTTLSLSAQTLTWKGHTWNLNPRDPIGDGTAGGQIKGSINNITLDPQGHLHLKISGTGPIATGAELWTADKLGFGTIYYVLRGPLTSMQKSVVASGFLYGPAAHIGKDGENELDIEFSQWNGAYGPINADFTFYPNTGHAAHGPSYEENFFLPGEITTATCRIDWSPTKVTASIWSGIVPITAPTSTALKTHTYEGTAKTIPQSALPMMFNLWTYGAYPTHPLDITIEDFQFIPAISTTLPK